MHNHDQFDTETATRVDMPVAEALSHLAELERAVRELQAVRLPAIPGAETIRTHLLQAASAAEKGQRATLQIATETNEIVAAQGRHIARLLTLMGVE